MQHPFILPTLSVEIDPEQQDGTDKSAGLRIMMPYCQLDTTKGEQRPDLDSLFDIYKGSIQTPEWLAFVGEIMLNLCDAVDYLHNHHVDDSHKYGLVHLDIRGRNVVIHNPSTIEGRLDELFDGTRVYLADRGGGDLPSYMAALPRPNTADPSQTRIMKNYTERETNVIELIAELERTDNDGEKTNIMKLNDIRRLGNLAAFLLTGSDVVKTGYTATFESCDYVRNNQILKKADKLIETIRKTSYAKMGRDNFYSNVGELITDLRESLSELFFVARREDLPQEAQDRLGTLGFGYVVCSPTRFMDLVYTGRRLSNQEIEQLQGVAKKPYRGKKVVLQDGVEVSKPKININTSEDYSALITAIRDEQRQRWEEESDDIARVLHKRKAEAEAAQARLEEVIERNSKVKEVLGTLDGME